MEDQNTVFYDVKARRMADEMVMGKRATSLG